MNSYSNANPKFPNPPTGFFSKNSIFDPEGRPGPPLMPCFSENRHIAGKNEPLSSDFNVPGRDHLSAWSWSKICIIRYENSILCRNIIKFLTCVFFKHHHVNQHKKLPQETYFQQNLRKLTFWPFFRLGGPRAKMVKKSTFLEFAKNMFSGVVFYAD